MSTTRQPAMPLPYRAAPSTDLSASCTERVDAWLAAATVTSPDSRLFATLIAAREVGDELRFLGLTNEQLHALCERQFGTAWVERAGLEPFEATALTGDHAAFVNTLHDILTSSRGPEVLPADAACIATIIAHACLRPDHLWRDLGLSGRDDVTRLLGRYFPTVMARNVNNLRWKKFLSFEVAAVTGLEPGPAPGCPGCEDFRVCFPRS